MQVKEARELIGQVVTARIECGFARLHQEHEFARHPRPVPAFRPGDHAPGHDSSRVPAVPLAEVATTVTDDQPKVFLSFRMEYGGRPYRDMCVRRSWLHQVVRPGWAVMDDRVVVDVLEWATGPTGRRPSKVASCWIWTDFDEGPHGWRAWGDMREYDVDWRAQAPVLVPSDPVLR
ncbi:hypothetical protein F9278_07515 [Streptomyces phaeolivaceus]|uniref:Uncharacterized protein n=1 Tax=Streptomyces phaeolivaceus TaxID=2653200 RepID=A0A5P8JYX0_9ACTN|nr:hypothetical protein [Streptomyces phaeolivaceus]QFQ96061.1 hypothetical protein F9278_07515 [Streptomyces phaeolivaceus]